MMNVRKVGILFALLLVLVLAIAAPAYAQSGGNNANNGQCLANMSGNANATGMNNWQRLCGQSAVFTFQYDGNSDPANVEMAVSPQNAANFMVYTANSWASRASYNPSLKPGDLNYGAGAPIGMGTQRFTGSTAKDNLTVQNNGNYMWSGGTPEAGTYYVLVQPAAGQLGQDASFWINFSGSGISNAQFVPAGQAPANMNVQLAQATGTKGNTSAANKPPVTLPKTGGEFEALQLLGIGLAALSGGLFLRRRTK